MLKRDKITNLNGEQSMLSTDYGKNMRKARHRLGLTQKELARKLRLSQVTVSSYEVNVRTPSPRFVTRFLALMKKAEINDFKFEDFRPD